MCGHVGERRVNISVVDLKDEKKQLHIFRLVAINLRSTQYTSFTDITGIAILL